MALFNEKAGFLFHHPPRLVAVPGVIDQQWIDKARADWHGTVRESLDLLRGLIKDLKCEAQMIRDPWLPIEPILNLDEPLTPLLDAIDRMADERPSFLGTPMVAGYYDRALLILCLLANSRLRRANYGKMTWRPDNTGNLRWERKAITILIDDQERKFEGYWKLVIPQKDMKNEGSEALPMNGEDLNLVLDPTDETLYQAIEFWIGVVDPKTGKVDETGSSRRLLHGGDCGDALFPGGSENGGIGEEVVGHIVYRFSTRYLVGRPWSAEGIEGVKPFGPNAFRDIVATHVLKATGSLKEAADALFDSEKTLARHYARFTSEEKTIRINKIIRDSTRSRRRRPRRKS